MSSLKLKKLTRMICPSALLIGSLFFVSACSHSGGGGGDGLNSAQSVVYHDRAVPLADVSSDKCLNLQTYYQTLLSLAPDVQARKMTTDFSTTAIQDHPNLSDKFLTRVEAGAFDFQDRPVTSLPELGPMQQTGCETVVFQGAGHQNTYTVTAFTKDSLTLKNDWNGEKVIQWMSPTSLKIIQTDLIASDLCDDKAMMQIHVTTVYNWGGDAVASSTLPGNTISPDFLAKVSDAKGFSVDSLFTTTAPATPDSPVNPTDGGGGTGIATPASAERFLLVDKLKELEAQTGRADLGLCH